MDTLQSIKNKYNFNIHISGILDKNNISFMSYNFNKHAEVKAIKKIDCKKIKKNKDLTLFSIRLTPNNVLGNGKPCQHCLHIIKKSNYVRSVVYSDCDGNLIKQNILDLTSDHISKGYRIFK